MLSTTDAIVLSLQPYSDKAHILHAYTRAGGRVNYMVYGIGRKNTTGKYSPLSILQITTDNKSIRTAQLSYIPTTLTTDPYKCAIVLFLSEVLYHVLRHPMQDEMLWDFIAHAIEELDASAEPQNFHLSFLVGFAAKLGFAMPQELSVPKSRSERQKALQALCNYFAEHVETWQTPKSLDVLMEVFD